MTKTPKKVSDDRSAFRPEGLVTLADVLARVEADYEGARRRDTVSALRRIEAELDLDLTSIAASPSSVRPILQSATASALSVSEKSAANIRSRIKTAVEEFGMRRISATEADLAPEWNALLAMAPAPQYHWPLNRLARYCSATGISPEAVGRDVLIDFHAALEAECFVKKPRLILKQTIGAWNHCRARSRAWPKQHLSSPFKTAPEMLPLSALPESFRNEVARLREYLATGDPFDLAASPVPLKSASIEGYVLSLRRAASALVRGTTMTEKDITGFGVFFKENNFAAILQDYYERGNGKNKAYAYKIAGHLRRVARDLLKAPEETIDLVDRLTKRMAPATRGRMGDNPARKLGQFDDHELMRRFLNFPFEEAARARALSNLKRRAKGLERAVAMAILIDTGMRLANLRSIRLDRNVVREGGAIILQFGPDEMKNGERLRVELSAGGVALLNEHLAEHRCQIAGAESEWLFPAPDGAAPRSPSAMRDAVSRPLAKHAGIDVNPHLYRHITAKIVIERDPRLALPLARRLGQRTVDTAIAHYLGSDTVAASRRLNTILDAARAGRD